MKAKNLIKPTVKWHGNDLNKCLDEVYQNRIAVDFKIKPLNERKEANKSEEK